MDFPSILPNKTEQLVDYSNPYFFKIVGFSPLSIQIVRGGVVKSSASVVMLTRVVEKLKNFV